MAFEQGEKTLRELGLTSSQARVYLTLIRLGDHSTVKTLSATSKVARQDLYRILTELRELSLVEMLIGNPAMFGAIPLQEALAILMERKNEKTQALRAEATELIDLFAKEKQAVPRQENDQFVLIPKREVVIRRIQKAIESTEKSILIATPWHELTRWVFILHDSWMQALTKDVKVQWIVEKREDAHQLTEITREIIKEPNFKLRIEPTSSQARFGIYDGKEAFIAILSTLNAFDSPALWTNNPAVIYILSDYFETKWKLREGPEQIDQWHKKHTNSSFLAYPC